MLGTAPSPFIPGGTLGTVGLSSVSCRSSVWVWTCIPSTSDSGRPDIRSSSAVSTIRSRRTGSSSPSELGRTPSTGSSVVCYVIVVAKTLPTSTLTTPYSLPSVGLLVWSQLTGRPPSLLAWVRGPIRSSSTSFSSGPMEYCELHTLATSAASCELF